jgi:hypothetical protein
MFNRLDVVKRLLESFKAKLRGRVAFRGVSRLTCGFVIVHWILAKAEVSGFTSLPLGIENARIDDLRAIVGELQDGAPGYYSNYAAARGRAFRLTIAFLMV